MIMKKVRLDIKINVPDSFQQGDCKKCPLHTTTEWETSYQVYETTTKCNIGYTAMTCPLEEVKK